MDAVIFDLDGTLVDSEPLHGRALAAAFAPLGVTPRPEEYVGLPDEEAIGRILARAGDAPVSAAGRLLDAKRAEYHELLRHEPIPTYEGARGLAERCAEACAVAVCTASGRAEALATLRSAGLDDVLGCVIARDDVERSKPDPEPYLAAARCLGLAPARCIAIEDSAHGLASARRAGLCAIGVAHTSASAALSHAHHIAPSIGALSVGDLRRLFESWRGEHPVAAGD